MTDKQIICKCNDKECGQCSFEEQLKAKEQECEGLKEEIKKHNDDMFKNPPEKRFYCKGCTLPYISKKLRQTLTEIKEIVKEQLPTVNYNFAKSMHPEMFNCYEQILQKISEVVDESNN